MDVALKTFGGVHVLIANAGILRDKSFLAMTDQEWDIILAVHLRYVSITDWYFDSFQRPGEPIRLVASHSILVTLTHSRH